MKTDGKFIISGGGITQGIQKELGLSSQECKQLGSIWTQIINEFDDPNNMQVSNNKNETPDKSNNYLVHKDAVIQFSKACWQKIVDLVNRALNKNIEIEDTEKVDTPTTPANMPKTAAADTKNQTFDIIVNQAKDAILQHLNEFDLDENTKTDLQNKLEKFDTKNIPESAKQGEVSLVDAACMLLSKMLPVPGQGYCLVARLIQSDNRFEDTEITNPSAPASIQGKKISEVADAINQNSDEKIQKLYNKAQQQLVSYLQSNPDRKFKSPYDSNREITASELLKYVQNMKFRSDNYGSAQAYDFTPEDGINESNGILVNTNKFCTNPYTTPNEAIKVLVHESLHCAFSTEHFPFNNQKEEMYCERQAIQLTSEILRGSTDNSLVYGHTFTELGEMSEEELTKLLEAEFINKGYEHRPKDTEGNVNINGYEIQAGDVVIIDGQSVGNVGRNGCILDQLDEQKIYLMGRGGGMVIFADSQPPNSRKLEIKRNGQEVMTAYIMTPQR